MSDVNEENMTVTVSPMMQKYLETKQEYKDCILFYRLGDFYEMFFDDAKLVAKELELTLTGKSCGLKERAPMCGVPYHAVETYLNSLVSRGYKVAICEQVEDPRTAKGLVKREVTRVVTPGTNLNTQALDETKNNYIMSIVYVSDRYGLSACDVTTGDFYTTEVNSDRKLLDEISKFAPSEIICNEAFEVSQVDLDSLKQRFGLVIYPLESFYFDDEMCKKALTKHFHLATLDALGLRDIPCATVSSGALLLYLLKTQKNDLSHLSAITPYTTGKFMVIDSFTRRNLEITETLREKQKRGSLLWVLDKTKTAMGARMLRSWIEQPLIKKEAIISRQEAIEALIQNGITREELREYLSPIYDLERLMGRISYKNCNPRDLIAFCNSIAMLPPIQEVLCDVSGEFISSVKSEMDTLEDLHALIEKSIVEEPPLLMKEGGIIKEGYNSEVDTYRSASIEGKNWLAQLEEKEREKTGIKNLRIRYNKVFGYFLEVTNSYKDQVPDYYMRKQTLANAERYITPELKELEDTILGAEDKLSDLEYDLFCQVRDKIAEEVVRIQKSAKAVAKLDVICSLALVAERNQYIRPNLNEKGIIDIKDGRHPVVEQMLSARDMFIPNDTYLDNYDNRIDVITGPNMAGKSTYMRQSALIVLMAQIGCFVPAKEANVCLVDRIFTRVGASDDLASGQSTFMVEMTEVANILRNATADSLLILDEIGRGTSTFDGLSIAWAVIEYISDTRILGAKTLFATHYHELTELEGVLSGVHNHCIAVKENGDDIVFLRKIIKGGADRSYGIQVAKLAGVPQMVIDRAKELADDLSDNDLSLKTKEQADAIKETGKHKHKEKKPDEVDLAQMSLFDTVKDTEIIEELSLLDVGNMTPLEALNTIYRLQNKIKNRW